MHSYKENFISHQLHVCPKAQRLTYKSSLSPDVVSVSFFRFQMYVQELDIIDPSPDSSPATVLSPTPPPGLLSSVESGIDDSPVGDELFAFGPPSTHRPKKW